MTPALRSVVIASADADVLRWRSAVVANGGFVSGPQLAKVSAFVRQLKGAGVWPRLDRLWLFATENANQALIDLKELTAATATNSPTHTPMQGYTGNGSTSFVDANWAPADGINYQQDDCTFGFWTFSTGQDTLAGCQTTNDLLFNTSNPSGIFATRLNTKTVTGSDAVPDGSGLSAASRTGASATRQYKNGALLPSPGTATSTTRSAVKVGFGKSDGGFSTKNYAMGFVGASLTATQHFALYCAFRAYLTAVGNA